MNTVVKWLQLFRAQTFPATLLMVLVPFLANTVLDLNAVLKLLPLSILLLLIHFFSFGHNSLIDVAMMYDQKDPGKQHHPLVSGVISLHAAHNVIHWGLTILIGLAALLTITWSKQPVMALLGLIGWIAFGHAYNDGLSKESLFGFMAMSLSMTSMAAWGWYLSFDRWDLNMRGLIYLVYVFFTILYQVSWSGFVKEMEIGERSNILAKMGAKLMKVEFGPRLNRLSNFSEFIPGKARFYAYFTKATGLFLGGLLCWLNYSMVRLVIYVVLAFIIAFLLHKATKPRIYNRAKELMQMSLMEIATIFMPIPLMLEWPVAAVLMIFGIVYFYVLNKILWGKPYPRV
jgi:hypothetical protein